MSAERLLAVKSQGIVGVEVPAFTRVKYCTDLARQLKF